MNRNKVIPAMLAVAALTLAGCGHADTRAPQSTTVEVSYDVLLNEKNITRQVSLPVGDTLRIVLGSNASTGYQWTTQVQITDTSVLAQSSHQSVAATDAKPGAPGTEVWTFDALKAGTATLTTTYGQPWPGGQKDTWTFTATVTVR